MHSDLLKRCHELREHIAAPPFPSAAIRSAAMRPTRRAPHRRSLAALVLAVFSVAAFAAAAEMLHYTRLTFTPSGGMVISSTGKSVSRLIHSDAEVVEAAKHLSFQAIPPAGLPAGTKPMKLDMSGTDLLTITYVLPTANHKLWLFITKPATIARSNAPAATQFRLQKGYTVELWRVGPEEVVAVSDGLAPSEFTAIKAAMERAARER